MMSRPRLLSSLFAALPAILLSAATPLAHAGSPAPPGDAVEPAVQRRSLQELLEELRAAERIQLEAMRGSAEAALRDLRAAVQAKDAGAVRKSQAALEALLPAAAPLLVAQLDPGAEAKDTERAVAAALAQALAARPAPSIHVTLATIAREGSPSGRVNALRVLPGTADPARVASVLREVYEDSEGAVRSAALEALARVGREEDKPLFLAALRSGNSSLVRAALHRVTETADPAFVPIVRSVLADPAVAAPALPSLLAYLRVLKLEKEDVEALLGVIESGLFSVADRTSALALLQDSERAVDSRARRRLRDLADGTASPEIARTAQETLAILGDNRARKDLLAGYDERVERAPDSSDPWLDRANCWYRIREWSKALADYRKAIQLSAGEPRVQPQAHVGAARCSALTGKVKQAADYLQSAPITTEQLRALAADPVFAELRASRYGRVFGLDE